MLLLRNIKSKCDFHRFQDSTPKRSRQLVGLFREKAELTETYFGPTNATRHCQPMTFGRARRSSWRGPGGTATWTRARR